MDYTIRYERISRPFRSAGATQALNALNRALVYAFAIAYVALLGMLAFQGDARLLKAALVPAATFTLATGLRAAINRPRPYEAHAIDPLVRKDTHGKSCPSRHMTSAVVIACALWWISPVAGIAALVGCLLIAFTRIVGGVHYPTDIAAAIALALACAIVGFVVIP